MRFLFKVFATSKLFSHTFFASIIAVMLAMGSTGFKYASSAPSEVKHIQGGDKDEVLPVTPFALVELFTSEGCSSCPPADKLLTELVEKADQEGLKLFALSFHVDYWDYLGWKDPFARKEYTNRQRRYARALGSSVYTPQMVINGSAEFVGSNRSEASQTINYAFNLNEGPVKIDDLKMTKRGDKIKIDLKTIGNGQGKIANIAIVERDLSIAVKRGENRGRNLHHDNVVRLFKSINISEGSNFNTEVTLPDNIEKDKTSVIVYLQSLNDMEVFDAYGSEINQALANK